MARKFVRAFDKSRPIHMEPGGGPMLVEVDQAYETTEHLVARMLEAGVRLEEARARAFDFSDGVDSGPSEVELLRAPGVDLADVSALGVRVSARVVDAQAAAKKAAEAGAEKAASDAREALKRELRAELAKEAEAAVATR